MFERWTGRARAAYQFAEQEAASDGSAFVEPHHLLMGVLQADPSLAEELSPALTVGNLRRFLNRQLTAPLAPREVPLSHTSRHVLAYAGGEAASECKIDSRHILMGILRERDCDAAAFLRSLAVSDDMISRSDIV